MTKTKSKACPFCNRREDVLMSNEYAYAILDRKPISPGHALVISRVHASTIFDLPADDYAGCFALLRDLKKSGLIRGGAESFNVVVNCGKESGQSVFHAHIHIVPRYRDIKLPQSIGTWADLAQVSVGSVKHRKARR
jgi:diadenosine tetraphosphate (Ap4A) HIT family hydrolase